jgi:hypothetical protein
MACEVTPTSVGTLILEHQLSSILQVPIGHRFDDADVEVDEVGVVDPVALGGADPVRIVTDRAGRILLYDVRLVNSARTVGEEDISVVALVTQGVRLITLDRAIRDTVRLLE